MSLPKIMTSSKTSWSSVLLIKDEIDRADSSNMLFLLRLFFSFLNLVIRYFSKSSVSPGLNPSDQISSSIPSFIICLTSIAFSFMLLFSWSILALDFTKARCISFSRSCDARRSFFVIWLQQLLQMVWQAIEVTYQSETKSKYWYISRIVYFIIQLVSVAFMCVAFIFRLFLKFVLFVYMLLGRFHLRVRKV